MVFKVLNFAGFEAVWFAAVAGAAAGWVWLGPLVALAWLAVHLHFVRSGRVEELLLVMTAAALGYALDSLLFVFGLLTVAPGAELGGPSPLWVVALWAGFAGTLRHSMSFLLGRYGLAMAAGAVFGPIAYAGAAAIGAISVAGPPGLLAVGVEYALALPALLWLSAQLNGAVAAPTTEGSGQ